MNDKTAKSYHYILLFNNINYSSRGIPNIPNKQNLKPMITEQGIVTDITSSQYHSISRRKDGMKYCSKSQLWKFNEDQEAWLHYPNVEVTRPMKLGSYLDACLLDPTEKKFFYAKEENPHLTKRKDGTLVCSSNAAKEWRKEKEENNYFEISAAEKHEIEKNLEMIKQNNSAQELLKNMAPQCAMFTELDGVPFKALIDIVPSKTGWFGNALADMKRTSQFHPKAFQYHLITMGYHWQAAIYLDIWNKIQEEMAGNNPDYTPDFRNDWYFLIVNSGKPYGCGVAKLSEKKLEQGREEYRQAVRDWKYSCYNNNFKNPYDRPTEIIEL